MGERAQNVEWMIGQFTYYRDLRVTEVALADYQARMLIERPLEGWTVTEEYHALVDALASEGALFTPDPDDTWMEWTYGDSELRSHMQRIVDRMDIARPWPEPVVRGLSPQAWEVSYQEPRLVGYSELLANDIWDRLHYYHSTVQYDDREISALVLQLRSGTELALVSEWWPGSTLQALVTRDLDASPQSVIDKLVDTGLFAAEEFTVVEPARPGEDAAWVGPTLWALPSAAWSIYHDYRVVARAPLTIAGVDHRVRWMHSSIDWDGERVDLLVVGTRSGVEVAFVGPWWPGGTGVAVVTRDQEITGMEVVDALVNTGRFGADEFVLLEPKA